MFPVSANKLNKLRIVLATGAPQRIDILKKANITFESRVSGYEEKMHYEDTLNTNPLQREHLVKVNAEHKAQIVYQLLKDRKDEPLPDIVIGLDTMVFNNVEMLGKPKTKDEAKKMLKTLSGKSNDVLTAVVIYYKGVYNEKTSFVETTRVHMNKLTDAEIDSYIETGEPLKYAGGYAIQGLAATFIKRIDGDYYNVMGMPLCTLTEKLKEFVR